MTATTTLTPRSETISQGRSVERLVAGMATSDGAGVKLTRVLTQPLQRRLDPFLMLDAFGTDNPDDYIAGFPSHPHRGFETVTYMLTGHMQHKDSVGNTGDLVAGSVQWMTAGRGIVHSEMPQQTEGSMSGFQLWVNLPAAKKMTAPRYQDIPPEQIPRVVTEDGVAVKVVAGTHLGTTGPVGGVDTDPTMLDVTLPAGVRHEVAVKPGYTVLAYVFEGGVGVPGAPGDLGVHTLVLFGDGDTVALTGGAAGGRVLLLAGKPLKEPIV